MFHVLKFQVSAGWADAEVNVGRKQKMNVVDPVCYSAEFIFMKYRFGFFRTSNKSHLNRTSNNYSNIYSDILYMIYTLYVYVYTV